MAMLPCCPLHPCSERRYLLVYEAQQVVQTKAAVRDRLNSSIGIADLLQRDWGSPIKGLVKRKNTLSIKKNHFLIDIDGFVKSPGS